MTIKAYRIYEDVETLIKDQGTRDPREILLERGVKLIPFKENTKLLGMYKIIKRNRFVFYNSYVDSRLNRMVLAHELGHDSYHRKEAANSQILEYDLFSLTSMMEMEANIFCSHLLLDTEDMMADLKEGYNYKQIASLHDVDVNLVILKINEMQKMDYPVKREGSFNSSFFKDINGKDRRNLKTL